MLDTCQHYKIQYTVILDSDGIILVGLKQTVYSLRGPFEHPH